MTPRRLALVHEFERELRSPTLRDWFDALRPQEAALEEFSHPIALREFLHSPDIDVRKPEIWRALVRGGQRRGSPEATLFLIGLLEPALGRLVDRFQARDLDADDLWQEAVGGALRALGNPKLPERQVVLVGIVRDTLKHLCRWVRIELSKAEEEAPLFRVTYQTNFDALLDGVNGEALLVDWCRRAGISSADMSLVLTTRILGFPLSRYAQARSRPYERLLKRRSRAEARLRTWLSLRS
jgi:DNA-directed RNA polymerase specialized sigma24 family protein